MSGRLFLQCWEGYLNWRWYSLGWQTHKPLSNNNEWNFKSLINTGNVASFIDNLMVEIKEKEGHDKIIKEILKRREENDLYKTRKIQIKGREGS